MKSLTILNTTTLMLLLVVFAAACEPKKQEDSAEVAKSVNDATFEDRDEEKDADFVVNAIANNYAEIKLSELALSRSTDTGVKEIATMLQADHTKVLNELKAYAEKRGIAVPEAETDEALKERNSLAEKEAKDFDEKWCDMLEDNHKKTINKFETRINKTEDMELKNWISATLPGLRGHLEMIKKHEDRVDD